MSFSAWRATERNNPARKTPAHDEASRLMGVTRSRLMVNDSTGLFFPSTSFGFFAWRGRVLSFIAVLTAARGRERKRKRGGRKSDVPFDFVGDEKGMGGAEMCNYTYLIKYYDLCGRQAEASREEGQKTVFEMQGAAEQHDAEMSEGAADQNGIHFFFAFTPMQDALTLPLVLSHKELGTELGYRNAPIRSNVESGIDFQLQILISKKVCLIFLGSTGQ